MPGKVLSLSLKDLTQPYSRLWLIFYHLVLVRDFIHVKLLRVSLWDANVLINWRLNKERFVEKKNKNHWLAILPELDAPSSQGRCPLHSRRALPLARWSWCFCKQARSRWAELKRARGSLCWLQQAQTPSLSLLMQKSVAVAWVQSDEWYDIETFYVDLGVK